MGSKVFLHRISGPALFPGGTETIDAALFMGPIILEGMTLEHSPNSFEAIPIIGYDEICTSQIFICTVGDHTFSRLLRHRIS